MYFKVKVRCVNWLLFVGYNILLMVYDYEYDEESQKMRINCVGGLYGDSIEDYSACMATTIDKLLELKKVVGSFLPVPVNTNMISRNQRCFSR